MVLLSFVPRTAPALSLRPEMDGRSPDSLPDSMAELESDREVVSESCGTAPLADRLRANLSLQNTPSPEPETPRAYSPMESLPPELIEAIGHAVCRLTPVGPPTEIRNLLILSRRFYDVLGPRNAGFYANLFKERFDHRSAERRWAQVRPLSRWWPFLHAAEFENRHRSPGALR